MEELYALKMQLDSADEETRRLAAAALIGQDFSKVKDLALRALGDESWRVRKEAVAVLLAASPDAELVEQVCQLLRSHDNAGLRNSAVEVLERLGGRYLDIVLRYAFDEDGDVRKFIVDVLGTIGDRSVAPQLVKLLGDKDANVRSAVAETLGRLREAEAVPALVAVLGDESVTFRHTVLDALAAIGSPVPVDRLVSCMDEPLLRRVVYECLGSVGDIEAVPLLVEGAASGARSVREAAVRALVRLRRRLPDVYHLEVVDRALAGLRDSSLVDGLLSSIRMASPETREALLEVLAVIGDRRGICALVKGCRDLRVSRFCLRALRNMGSDAEQILLAMFPDADLEEKGVIISLCGEIGSPAFEGLLREGLTSDHQLLRLVAAKAVAKTGLAVLMPETARLLDDVSPEVRESASTALVKLAALGQVKLQTMVNSLANDDDPEKRRLAVQLSAVNGDITSLLLLMKDDSSRVRAAAVSSIAAMKKKEYTGLLAVALADDDLEVRLEAATGLGTIRDAGGVAPLLVALGDLEPAVTCASIRSLGRIGGEDAALALRRHLDDGNGMVAITALESLGRLEGQAASRDIARCLNHDDPDVLKLAIELLSQWGGDWLESGRERLLRHPHWGVRSAYAKALARGLGNAAAPFLRDAMKDESDDMVRELFARLLDGLN